VSADGPLVGGPSVVAARRVISVVGPTPLPVFVRGEADNRDPISDPRGAPSGAAADSRLPDSASPREAECWRVVAAAVNRVRV